MDKVTQLEQRLKELETRLEVFERLFTVTPTNVSINLNVRTPGTIYADRLYRRGNSGNYSEVTT